MIKKILKQYSLFRYIHQSILKFTYPLLAKLKYRLVKRNDISYLLDLSKVIDVNIFLYGAWEKETIRFMNNHIHPGDVVIEAGSNIGAHSFIIADLVAANGRVFCFEPTEYAYTRLKTNALLNHFSNIRFEKKILSDNKNTLSLSHMASDFHHEEFDNVKEDISEVPITSIDSYTNTFNRLDLIKIDVDGFDYRVLVGASDAIRKFKPVVMIELAEFTLKSAGDSIKDILDFFYQNDYEGFYISDDSKIQSFQEVISKSANGTSHVDAYFRPKH